MICWLLGVNNNDWKSLPPIGSSDRRDADKGATVAIPSTCGGGGDDSAIHSGALAASPREVA